MPTKDAIHQQASFVPPAAVAKAANEGLMLRMKFRRGSTVVGIALGHELAKRAPIPAPVIRRMYSYFARHEVDKKGKNFGNEARPSNGRIAWLLWGGDAGKEWAASIRKKLVEESSSKRKPRRDYNPTHVL